MMTFPFGAPVNGVSKYQAAVLQVHEGDDLVVARELSNPVDPNAYKVSSVSGETLGYLPKEIAARLVREGAPFVLQGSVERVLDQKMTVGLRIWLKGAAQAQAVCVETIVEDKPKVAETVVVRSSRRVLGTLVRIDTNKRQVVVRQGPGHGEVCYPDALVEVLSS